MPIGAVVLDPIGDVVAAAANEREQRRSRRPTPRCSPSAGGPANGEWRLDGHTLFVTLEPCAMCAGAVVLARVERGLRRDDPKAGAVSSLFDVVRDPRLNHRVDVRGGILEAECGEVLRAFFGR